METLLKKTRLGAEQSLLARHEALFRVSRALNVYRDPRELFRILANELRQVVDSSFLRIFLRKKPSPGGSITIRNRCSFPREITIRAFPR
jgi:hypothetical protein